MSIVQSNDAGQILSPGAIQAAAQSFVERLLRDGLIDNVGCVQTLIGAEAHPDAAPAMAAGFEDALPFNALRDLVVAGEGAICAALQIEAFDREGRALLRQRFELVAPEPRLAQRHE